MKIDINLKSQSAVDALQSNIDQVVDQIMEKLTKSRITVRSRKPVNLILSIDRDNNLRVQFALKTKKGSASRVTSGTNPKVSDDSATIKAARKVGAHSKQLFQELNSGKVFPKNVFGYWRPGVKKSGRLPFPVALQVRGYDKEKFIKKLKSVQSSSKKTVYKGTAPNRWTGGNAGASEYSKDGWRWPVAALTYIKAGVPPSKAFYKFITGRSLASLPY